MQNLFFFCFVILSLCLSANAQTRTNRAAAARASAVRAAAGPAKTAVVLDETLSVLRTAPSLFATPVQRMRRGRIVRILASTRADGVEFFQVAAAPSGTGWLQSEAVFGKFRAGDVERLVRLIQASSGFDQIELASAFFSLFPESPLRPSILLLFGDLLEETAAKLTREAASRLDRREMAASAAPLHSYYLNFVMLDRYRKMGITFFFDSASRAYHYDGASWREIIRRFPQTSESQEAQKRLDALNEKMKPRAGTGSN